MKETANQEKEIVKERMVQVFWWEDVGKKSTLYTGEKDFKGLEKGDVFRLYEKDGTPVEDKKGNKLFIATGNPYLVKIEDGYTWSIENIVFDTDKHRFPRKG